MRISTNFCPFCGEKLPTHTNFCPNCEKKLVEEQEKPESAVSEKIVEPAPTAVKQAEVPAPTVSENAAEPAPTPVSKPESVYSFTKQENEKPSEEKSTQSEPTVSENANASAQMSAAKPQSVYSYTNQNTNSKPKKKGKTLKTVLIAVVAIPVVILAFCMIVSIFSGFGNDSYDDDSDNTGKTYSVQGSSNDKNETVTENGNAGSSKEVSSQPVAKPTSVSYGGVNYKINDGILRIKGEGTVDRNTVASLDSSLYDHIIFDSGLVDIPDNAFSDCKNITKVEFRDVVSTIGKETFKNCPLELILIGPSITSIGENAFQGCKSRF